MVKGEGAKASRRTGMTFEEFLARERRPAGSIFR
jgi:hypothetical protein